MNQMTLTTISLIGLAIACGAYFARDLAPNISRLVGYTSFLIAMLLWVVSSTLNAFYHELTPALQVLTLPGSATKTTFQWIGYFVHITLGLAGAAHSALELSKLGRSAGRSSA